MISTIILDCRNPSEALQAVIIAGYIIFDILIRRVKAIASERAHAERFLVTFLCASLQSSVFLVLSYDDAKSYLMSDLKGSFQRSKR